MKNDRTKSCTKVRDPVLSEWVRHSRELGVDWRSPALGALNSDSANV